MILEDVKMSSERYCLSELEKHISLEMLALHKNILEREKIDFRNINFKSIKKSKRKDKKNKHGQTFTTLTFQYNCMESTVFFYSICNLDIFILKLIIM